ncbi:MAG: hypothetical protein IT210_10200 [Armatimonadetes bacterium]|nr:hypothetical protein [Armatimonadota bacterium]
MKIHVPADHGATDILHEGEEIAVVCPHRYPGDTYNSLWFYCEARNDTDRDLPCAQIVIERLATGTDSYEPFWKHCLWSADGKAWERIPSEAQRFGTTTLMVESPLAAGRSLWIAETYPLPYAHYEKLRSDIAAPAALGITIRSERIGGSVLDRPIYAYHIGKSEGKASRSLLLVAGQHAVEESGKIFAETVLKGFHSGQFAGTAIETMLDVYNVTVVPLCNPDGCYDGRMNSNAQGVVMDSPEDDSPEMAALLSLVDAIKPAVSVNCHGWANEWGSPPYEDVYRWTDEDPLFAYLKANLPGCSTSGAPHLMGDHFRLECYAHPRYGTECIITEINWNCYIPPDGSPARRPSCADIRTRAVEYFEAIAKYCLQ